MSKTFRNGIPYSVDVRRLNEAFPVASLTEGRIVTHSQLEATIDSHKGSQRYYGVINSWLHQVRRIHGIYIIWKSSVGIEVLPPSGLLEHAESKTRQKIRQTGRALKIYGFVDRQRLNTLGQQRLDHDQRILGLLKDAMESTTKNLPVALAPIQSLPKPKLISEAPKTTTKGKEDASENGPNRVN